MLAVVQPTQFVLPCRAAGLRLPLSGAGQLSTCGTFTQTLLASQTGWLWHVSLRSDMHVSLMDLQLIGS